MEVPELDARDWNARQYLLPGTRESDLEQHVRQQPHRVRMAWRHWAALRTSLPAPSHAFLQLMLCLRALDVRVPRDVRQLLFQAVLAHWCWPVLDGIAKLPKCLYLFRPLRVRTFAAGTVVVRSLVARSQVLCGRHKYCGIPLDPACVECATEKKGVVIGVGFKRARDFFAIRTVEQALLASAHPSARRDFQSCVQSLPEGGFVLEVKQAGKFRLRAVDLTNRDQGALQVLRMFAKGPLTLDEADVRPTPLALGPVAVPVALVIAGITHDAVEGALINATTGRLWP